MRVAVEGCAHGDLLSIYTALQETEAATGVTVDLLICCGDFQAVRNEQDLDCVAVPPKFRTINNFYKYYSGELEAPVLTLFFGGNHEASNHLHQLPHGGWVAPKIYYMGNAGVVTIGGLRIAGISGIWSPGDYRRGRFERPPYDRSSMRSCYHVREFDQFRLMQLTGKVDIVVSHDWPRNIYHYGDTQKLLPRRSFSHRRCIAARWETLATSSCSMHSSPATGFLLTCMSSLLLPSHTPMGAALASWHWTSRCRAETFCSCSSLTPPTRQSSWHTIWNGSQ